ncbi:MAG: hypothetical protein GY795_24595 [Desulfobacterales bacterium]|nr:hypothetical protein [Desulfobacterales bacterium]
MSEGPELPLADVGYRTDAEIDTAIEGAWGDLEQAIAQLPADQQERQLENAAVHEVDAGAETAARTLFLVWLEKQAADPFGQHRADADQRAPNRCSCEGDSGLIVEFVDGGHPVARPCPRCNGDAYDRWRRGEYRSGVRRARGQSPTADRDQQIDLRDQERKDLA